MPKKHTSELEISEVNPVETVAVTTRAQAEKDKCNIKPLIVSSSIPQIGAQELKEAQKKDTTLSHVTAPLTDLVKKGHPNKVEWMEPQQKAFNKLKQALGKAPILRGPDFQRPFIVGSDASNEGLRAMLLQEFEDGLFPIVYASRKPKKNERRLLEGRLGHRQLVRLRRAPLVLILFRSSLRLLPLLASLARRRAAR